MFRLFLHQEIYYFLKFFFITKRGVLGEEGAGKEETRCDFDENIDKDKHIA